MKKIIPLLFVLLIPINGFANDFTFKSYSIHEINHIHFDITRTFKAELVQNKGNITIQCQGQKTQEITNLKINLDNFFMQINDFNFDEFADVAIAEDQGYMGVNWFYNIYFFNPKTKKFDKKIENMGTEGEIKIDKNQKEISGYSKSGQSIAGIFYRFQNGKPYVYLESDEPQGSGLVAKTYKNSTGKIIKNIITDYNNNPVTAKVLLPKASLYDSPREESKTTTYLIKGDQVTLLDMAESWQWLLVEYDGVKKSIKWVHADEFWSLTPDTEIPNSYLISKSKK